MYTRIHIYMYTRRTSGHVLSGHAFCVRHVTNIYIVLYTRIHIYMYTRRTSGHVLDGHAFCARHVTYIYIVYICIHVYTYICIHAERVLDGHAFCARHVTYIYIVYICIHVYTYVCIHAERVAMCSMGMHFSQDMSNETKDRHLRANQIQVLVPASPAHMSGKLRKGDEVVAGLHLISAHTRACRTCISGLQKPCSHAWQAQKMRRNCCGSSFHQCTYTCV